MAGFIKRMLGMGPKDIELPNESGTIDARLPENSAAVRKAMMQQLLKGVNPIGQAGKILDKAGK